MRLLIALLCVLVLSGCRDRPSVIAPEERRSEVMRVSVRYSDSEPVGLDIWVGGRHTYAGVELTELYTVQSATMPDGSALVGVGIYSMGSPWLAVFLAPPGGEVAGATGWVSANAEDAFDGFAAGEFAEETTAELAEVSGFPDDARIRRVWAYDSARRVLSPGPWRELTSVVED